LTRSLCGFLKAEKTLLGVTSVSDGPFVFVIFSWGVFFIPYCKIYPNKMRKIEAKEGFLSSSLPFSLVALQQI
jgi:hypothetical protein